MAEEVVASGHFAEYTGWTTLAVRTTYCTTVAAASIVCIPGNLDNYQAEIEQHKLVGFVGKNTRH